MTIQDNSTVVSIQTARKARAHCNVGEARFTPRTIRKHADPVDFDAVAGSDKSARKRAALQKISQMQRAMSLRPLYNLDWDDLRRLIEEI